MPKLLLPFVGLVLMWAATTVPRADATQSLTPPAPAVGITGAIEQVQMKCAHRRVCRPGQGCAWRKVCKRW